MSIECHYSGCKFHSINDGDEEPLCHHAHCKASDKELVTFERKRRDDLLKHAKTLQALAQWSGIDEHA